LATLDSEEDVLDELRSQVRTRAFVGSLLALPGAALLAYGLRQ
jgi:hypothetical protein